MTRVLGIHVGHDSNAALVVDGKVVACVLEERFVRIKHYSGLPVQAIEYCLAEAKLTMDQIDAIALTSKNTDGGPLRQLMNLEPVAVPPPKREAVVEKVVGFVRDVYKSYRPTTLEVPPIYYPTFRTERQLPVVAVEHHLAHAASAFYTSGRHEQTLVITADGIGDDAALSVWRVKPPASFELLYREGASGSLGWFYGLVTEGLGWWVGDGEGKTMGLAPYGSTRGVEGVLDEFCPHYEGGRLVKPHDFGKLGFWIDVGTYHYHFEETPRIVALVEKHGREAMAAEAQRVLEREMLDIVRHWLKAEGTRAACFAGGIMLNVKMNQRLWESGLLAEQYIFPESGDGGLAAGAALYANAVRGGALAREPLQQIYWGPAYDDALIRALLEERHLHYAVTDDPARAAAERLAAGKIVGWFQGRMETGPRALGGRSILMDPSKAENKDVINARVKFREAFRPFCPSMTPAAAKELLDPRARPERYMITSFDVRPEARHRIPAVVHADGTARPQIVEEHINPLFFRLLREFGARTGTECLLNTSFNIKGEPIVCHPREAIRCFFDTGLDSLVLGSFVLDK
ncbi:MAG TPA: carbamoyltransferase C-terminal domain-containing protein [Polyangiaceae bacterium]|nr:carbamoyltransferase C-terminal domain-containing protein [Polyangiaceae bacterium]